MHRVKALAYSGLCTFEFSTATERPPPQCDVLARLKNIGLPQSVKRANDPKELGAMTELATFDCGEGARVLIRM